VYGNQLRSCQGRRKHSGTRHPLAFGAVILARGVGEIEDTRKDYGEVRHRAFAEVEGKWFQCVYTLRGDVRHIITVHRINEKRVKRWLSR
jgi:hypothetical protein